MKHMTAPEAGFSLLEVIISLVILGLALSVVVLNMLPLLDERRRTATQGELTAAIEQARLLSIANNSPVLLRQFLDEQHPGLAQIVAFDENLVVLSGGACQAGMIRLDHSDEVHVLELQRLTCELRRTSS